jgi:hypothetical protein
MKQSATKSGHFEQNATYCSKEAAKPDNGIDVFLPFSAKNWFNVSARISFLFHAILSRVSLLCCTGKLMLQTTFSSILYK